MYTVYQHIFPNGKRYVGITRQSPEKRWGYKGGNYAHQVVGNAIRKYGWDNIEHDIFALCNTKEDAERLERWLVEYYDTTNPEHGYNILPGGDVSVNDATPEMRYKLGNGKRGKKHTEEEKQKISEGVKRAFNRPESNGCFGKRASDETKEKMRQSRANYLSDPENLKAQLERSSKVMTELWKNDDFRKETEERLAKYRRKKGEWKQTEEGKRKISEAQKGKWVREKSTSARRIVQLTLDGEYVATHGCILSAGDVISPKTAKSTSAAIGKCCRHLPNFNTCKGFRWVYEEEYLQILNRPF